MFDQKLYPFGTFTKKEILKCVTDGVINEDIWTEFICSLSFFIEIIQKINYCFKLKLIRVSFLKGYLVLRLIIGIHFIDNLLYFDISYFNAFIDDTKPLILIEYIEFDELDIIHC